MLVGRREVILSELLPNCVYHQRNLVVIDKRRHVVLVEVCVLVVRYEMVRAYCYRRRVNLLLPQ